MDVTGPEVAGALDRLAAVRLSSHSVSSLENATEVHVQQPDLLVQISPPLYVHVTPRSKSSRSHAEPSPVHNISQSQKEGDTQSGQWEAFLSAWTGLVGDPVLSKTISLALVLSLALNAVLLKGISAGAAGQTLVSSLASVVPGVRFSAANLGMVKEERDAESEEEKTSGDSDEADKRQGRPREQLRQRPMFGLGKNLAPIDASLANARSKVGNVGNTNVDQSRPLVTELPRPSEPIPALSAQTAITAITPARLVRPHLCS